MIVDLKRRDRSKVTKKVTIHNVHILDASGSMQGGKYFNALKGINDELTELKNSSDPNINYTISIIEFDSGTFRKELPTRWKTVGTTNIMPHYWLTPLEKTQSISGYGAHGGTPLFQTVGEVLEALIKNKKSDEACVVSVLTDGGENTSTGKYAPMSSWIFSKRKSQVLIALIDECKLKHNINVTFSGTQEDVETVIDTMSIERGNTMVHNNTAESITENYRSRSASLSSYSKSYAASGQAMTASFFAPTTDTIDSTVNIPTTVETTVSPVSVQVPKKRRGRPSGSKKAKV